MFPRHPVKLPLWQSFLGCLTAMCVQDGRPVPSEWQTLKRLPLRDACILTHAALVLAIERQRRELHPGIIEA